jgi:hypothetical protein
MERFGGPVAVTSAAEARIKAGNLCTADATSQAAEKVVFAREKLPQGLKPSHIQNVLRHD